MESQFVHADDNEVIVELIRTTSNGDWFWFQYIEDGNRKLRFVHVPKGVIFMEILEC